MNLTLFATVALLALVPLLSTAQLPQEREAAPSQHWAAPLYWQAKPSGTSVPAASLASNPLVFVAMTPCRLVDTRAAAGFTGAFGAPSLAGGVSRTFPIQSSTSCPVSSLALAYSLNVTVVPSGPLGYLTVYPTGQPRPLVSTLNSIQGQVVANSAIAPAGTPNGSVDVFATSNTDLIIDINGYYASTSDLNGNTGVGMGTDNTVVGSSALAGDTTGTSNTGLGYFALHANTTGGNNAAVGSLALGSNTTGNFNLAIGPSALSSNTVGGYNTALGHSALFSNTGASLNVALGDSALFNSLGSGNIAVGANAGNNLLNGSNNIEIGTAGMAIDNAVIRIGTSGTHAAFYTAGVRGVTTGASNAVAVVIDSNGQLGTVSSSRRFKEDIRDMGDSSANLLRLRPVTFRYRQPYADGKKPLDYGLIAEEVATVYPDLTVAGADGRVETVQYQKLTPMLLNELQKQHRHAQEQDEIIRLLQARLAALELLLSGKLSP